MEQTSSIISIFKLYSLHHIENQQSLSNFPSDKVQHNKMRQSTILAILAFSFAATALPLDVPAQPYGGPNPPANPDNKVVAKPNTDAAHKGPNEQAVTNKNVPIVTNTKDNKGPDSKNDGSKDNKGKDGKDGKDPKDTKGKGGKDGKDAKVNRPPTEASCFAAKIDSAHKWDFQIHDFAAHGPGSEAANKWLGPEGLSMKKELEKCSMDGMVPLTFNFYMHDKQAGGVFTFELVRFSLSRSLH
jgi:hypothetical protein